jgi:hypothetical protein
MLVLSALLSVSMLPLGVRAQDAAEARYAAAIAWANLVMVEEDFEAAARQADPAVAAQLTAEVLEQAWAQLSAQLGALTSLEPQDQSIVQGYHFVVLTGVFAAGTFNVQVVMSDDASVAGFFVRPPGA